MKLKGTLKARMERVEYATYINTIILFGHVGIPVVYWIGGLL